MAQADILALLERGPATVLMIKTTLGIGDMATRKQVAALLRKGKVVKLGAARSGKRSIAALYGLPGSAAATGTSTRVRVIEALEAEPNGLTLPQLVARTGIASRTIASALTRLRPLVHIADYRRINRDGIINGVWVLGEGEDAERPPGLRGQQATQRESMMARNVSRARSGLLLGQLTALRYHLAHT